MTMNYKEIEIVRIILPVLLRLKGMSQSSLASKAGCDRTALNKFLKGKINALNADTVVRVGEAIGTSIEDIIGIGDGLRAAVEKSEVRWEQVTGGTDILKTLFLIKRAQETRELDRMVESLFTKKAKNPLSLAEWINREVGQADVESEYKAVLKEEVGTVKMLGSPDVPNVPVDLLETFESLDITAIPAGAYREGLGPHEMRSEADRKLSPESTLKRAFENHRMLLILGDPGSGKTTILKYYAMLCLKDHRVELGFDESALPIYLPLREIESRDEELCPLHECLAKWALRHYISISADIFLGWLKNRQTLVLLDGLDEISEVDKRREICDWIDNAAEGLTKARFVVTSRWTGYRKADGIELGFPHLCADVRDFSEEQQAEFLEKWFVAAYQREPRDENVPESQWWQRQKQRGLDRAKAVVDFLAQDNNKSVRELAGVPMLLQVIAILWRERENLPQGRAELYQAALKYLLDYRDRRRKIKPLLPATQALRVLCPISFRMQEESKDEIQKTELYCQMQPILDTIDEKLSAERFCENLRDRAGLIADYGEDAYIFRHKSFREYLAGLELAIQARRDGECLAHIAGQFGEDWWNEPLRFFMGEVDDTLFDQFMDVLFKSDSSVELAQKSYNLLLTMISEAPQKRIDSLVERLNDPDSTENKRRYIVDCLKTIGSESALEAIKAFGEKEAESEAGSFAQDITAEQQIVVKLSTESTTATDLFKKLPASFRNRNEYNAEYILIHGGRYKYQGEVEKNLPSIYFSKYPVTNKRFRQFIDYLVGKKKDLTKTLPLTLFFERMLEFAITIKGFNVYLGIGRKQWIEKLRSTFDQEKRFKDADQPVVGVSWFSARSYCLWLSLLEMVQMNLSPNQVVNIYRLPTEFEWEWAASGGKREYPWGDDEPNNKLANYGGHVGTTTSVGRYPDGSTSEGLMDMAGNIWEWMENWYGEDRSIRSLRGGSWCYTGDNLRCSCRLFINIRPEGRSSNIGFRVVRAQS